MPASMWDIDVLQEPLCLAAQQGKTSTFQLLVEAAIAAEEAAAASTEAAEHGTTAEGSDSASKGKRRMAALSGAFLCAVKANKSALAKWILQKGQPLWTSGMLEPSLSATVSAAKVPLLRTVLANCSIPLPPEALADYLVPALDHPDKTAKALVQVVLEAGAASGQGWTKAQLAGAAAAAARAGNIATLQLLLEQPSLAWTCLELLPAVLHAAEVNAPIQVEIMATLLSAATDLWTAALLGPSLAAAARQGSVEVLDLLLKLAADGWSSQQLLPALQVLLNRRCYSPMYDLLKRATNGWTAQQLAPLLRIAAHCHERNLFKSILKRPSSGWSVEELLPAVEQVAQFCREPPQQGHGRKGVYVGITGRVCTLLYKEMVVNLLDATKDRWRGEHLANSMLFATMNGNEGVVEVLLRRASGCWSSQQLLPAVQEAIIRGGFFFWQRLLIAAKGQWTADRLAAVLGEAASSKRAGWDGLAAATKDLQALLSLEGIQWTAASLQCALLKAAAGNKHEAIKLLLAVPSVEWQMAQVEEALAAAVKGCAWDCFHLLLQLPVVASLSSTSLQTLVHFVMDAPVDQLKSGRYSYCSLEDSSLACLQSRCAAVLKLLVHPNHSLSVAKELSDVLVLAAAAGGDAELLTNLLDQLGLQWGKGQLLPAIRAALMCSQWDAMQQLLAVPGEGWSTRELLPELKAAVRFGCPRGVQKLLAMEGGWGAAVMEALADDVMQWQQTQWIPREQWECVEQVLAASQHAGWGLARLQIILVTAAASAAPLTTVQQLLAIPDLAWRAAHMVDAAMKAAAKGSWGTVGQLLAVGDAGWTGEQLGKVLAQAAKHTYNHHYKASIRKALGKLASQVLSVAGIKWKGVQLAAAAAEAAAREAWVALSLMLGVEDAEWTREQLLPVLEAVMSADAWPEQLRLVLRAGAEVQWLSEDLADALVKAVAAEEWVLAEQLVAAGSTGVWDVLQLGEVLEVAARQGQLRLVEQLLSAPSVGWTAAVMRRAMVVAVEQKQWRMLRRVLLAAVGVQGWGLEDVQGIMVAVVQGGQEQLVLLVQELAAMARE